jgi:hypothetical protein
MFCLVSSARADVTITATSASAGLATAKATTVTRIQGMKLSTHTDTGCSAIEGATGQFADALEAAPTTVVTTTVMSVVSAPVGDQHSRVPPGYVVTPR